MTTLARTPTKVAAMFSHLPSGLLPLWAASASAATPYTLVAFGAYMASFIFISLYYHYARGSVPFLLIFSGGYFYVGFSSLYVLWKMQQEADEAIAEAEEALA